MTRAEIHSQVSCRNEQELARLREENRLFRRLRDENTWPVKPCSAFPEPPAPRSPQQARRARRVRAPLTLDQENAARALRWESHAALARAERRAP